MSTEDTSRLLQTFESEASKLIDASLAGSTKTLYENAVKLFDEFRFEYNLTLTWPPTLDHLIQFIGFLSLKQYAATTVRSYLSGISFHIKIEGHVDVTQNFIIKKMLSGFDKLHKYCDTRKPITEDILLKLLPALKYVCSSTYECNLFQAAFSLAFYAFLRVGEITITPTCNDRNTIKCSDIFINEKGVLFIKINFSKTDQMGRSTTLVINPSKNVIANPLKYLTNYLNNRPEGEGPLFCHLNGKAVTRYQFYTILRSALKFINFDVNNFNTHSFKIGAATSAFLSGKSEDDIKRLGRWSSTCFQRYIRIN